MTRPFPRLLAPLALTVALACSFSETNETILLPPGGVSITDQTGRVWDVTYAVKVLGFNLTDFEYGLGKDAIQPLINPRLVSPGERGYPLPDETGHVIGVSIDGDSRAYPRMVIIPHEVVDETFGDRHVAVAY